MTKRGYRVVVCLKCKLSKHHEARGLCHGCYVAERNKERGRRTLINCANCKQSKPHHAKRLCNTCYNKSITTPGAINAYAKAHYAKNPHKGIIRATTRNEAMKGRGLLKTSCASCDSTKDLEYHHKQYLKGDENVIVLCKKCHVKQHKQKSPYFG